jgi:hypothetical protein
MIGFWISLAVLVLGLGTGLAFATVRGVGAWRQLKSARRALGGELAHISRTAAEIHGQLEAASKSAASLAEARDRLSASRARLDVQLAAIREARRTVRRLLWFLPGA